MDSVCEDGARGEEGVRVVDGSVGGVSREKGVYEGYFGGVFGDVRLDWKVGCVG